MNRVSLSSVLLALSGLTTACSGAGPASMDAGIDAAMTCQPLGELAVGDAGAAPGTTTCTAPDGGVPGSGACCYSDSQADVLAAPEMRLRYLDIRAPQGSALTTPILLSLLNAALEANTFPWLMQLEGAEDDGEVTVRTGFGLANADGTYSFPTGATSHPFDLTRYAPTTIPGTLSGEVLRTERTLGSIIVPVLNEAATEVQLELTLQSVRIVEAVFTSERSCIGFASSRGRFATAAVLDAFVEVETAKTGIVVLPGNDMTTICSTIAGPIAVEDYCEVTPQSEWRTPPDSLCSAEGCMENADCEEDVCDRGGDSDSGLPACNAWHLVANFAANGVEITN
jgi:hypothetical protein